VGVKFKAVVRIQNFTIAGKLATSFAEDMSTVELSFPEVPKVSRKETTHKYQYYITSSPLT
jgi:hypothetical protein